MVGGWQEAPCSGKALLVLLEAAAKVVLPAVGD